MPAGEQKIEVIRGDTKRVYFGVKNVTTEDISNYDLRLGYKTANIQPGSTNGLDHLLTLDIGTCISVAVGTKCKEMEVSLNGDPDLHGENISLVVYVYTLHPVLQVILPLEETESFTLQEFNIQIVGELVSGVYEYSCTPGGMYYTWLAYMYVKSLRSNNMSIFN